MTNDKIYDEIIEILEKRGLRVQQNKSKTKIFAYFNVNERLIISFNFDKLTKETFCTKSGSRILW